MGRQDTDAKGNLGVTDCTVAPVTRIVQVNCTLEKID